MGLTDTPKNRESLRTITQEQWNNLSATEQYNRVKLRENTGDETLLKYISYDKTEIIFRKNNPNREYIPNKNSNKKDKEEIKSQEYKNSPDIKTNYFKEKWFNTLETLQNYDRDFIEIMESKDQVILESRSRIEILEKNFEECMKDLSKCKTEIMDLKSNAVLTNKRIKFLEKENLSLKQFIEKLGDQLQDKINISNKKLMKEMKNIIKDIISDTQHD